MIWRNMWVMLRILLIQNLKLWGLTYWKIVRRGLRPSVCSIFSIKYIFGLKTSGKKDCKKHNPASSKSKSITKTTPLSILKRSKIRSQDNHRLWNKLKLKKANPPRKHSRLLPLRWSTLNLKTMLQTFWNLSWIKINRRLITC